MQLLLNFDNFFRRSLVTLLLLSILFLCSTVDCLLMINKGLLVFSFVPLFWISLNKSFPSLYLFILSLFFDVLYRHSFGYTGIFWFSIVILLKMQNFFSIKSSSRELFALYTLLYAINCVLFFASQLICEQSIRTPDESDIKSFLTSYLVSSTFFILLLGIFRKITISNTKT